MFKSGSQEIYINKDNITYNKFNPLYLQSPLTFIDKNLILKTKLMLNKILIRISK